MTPLQNRVTPLGELIAHPARGLVYGNRGCLHVVLGPNLLRWTPAGYRDPRQRPPDQRAAVLTPPSLVAVLRAGWEPLVPLIHPSADEAARTASGAGR